MVRHAKVPLAARDAPLIRQSVGYLPTMPKMRRKADLPHKDCAQCGRPFAWRKKWASVWDDVRFCSDRCRRDAKTRKG